ncbi:MAG: hypothetical protein ACTSRP_21770 [Candidatus Helarchaeota archaeon]
MEEYYENIEQYKNRNYKIILIGAIFAIIGYLLLCLNELNYFFSALLSVKILSLILIHVSPIFLSDLYSKLKIRDIGEIGNAIKPFIIIELVFTLVSFNVLYFL